MSSADVIPFERGSRGYAFDSVYTSVPNWDIGRPQGPFVYLQEHGLIRSPVLDVGCGTGELSMFLARHGHDVLGIDISALAIAQAREKARWRRIGAHFLVADALRLASLADAGLSFRTVVDSGLFHLLSATERDRYVTGLEAVLEPGGAYFVLGDAKSAPTPAYGISPEELRRRFDAGGGWELLFVLATTFERRHSRSPAYFAGVRRRS